MANHIQLQEALRKPYNKILFAKEVLSPVFGSAFKLAANPIEAIEKPTVQESSVLNRILIYGNIQLEDGTPPITCYEIALQPNVKIEHSKVAISRYIRKLLISGNAALVNFVSPINESIWRFSFIAKDSVLTEGEIKEKSTNPKRFTYIIEVGENKTNRTLAQRFEKLSISDLKLEDLKEAFSVEKLSDDFFKEYKKHYESFINGIPRNLEKSVFGNDQKAIRDFVKKMLGRIVFLYFVQKKGWLGASSIDYKDGSEDFIMELFKQSGGDDSFYSAWMRKLFFEALNQNGIINPRRSNDDFKMPNGEKVKVPYLNGGLFDMEEFDDKIITFNPSLFHNTLNNEDSKYRGFLDFLNAYNFTVYEDSPEEHTIAVDPEMLGHIFENLLEDNREKGAFYTPKEIVHYMCQESLIEYLANELHKTFNKLERKEIEEIVRDKDIIGLNDEHLLQINKILDDVRICDPAIGSGAFPMGLLQEIVAIKQVIAFKLENEIDLAKTKENIIQNSIYGVDIEKGAVDIARLRFWLSLVVDEDFPKPLPNLDFKIVVGNSLVSKFNDEVIEIDWSADPTKAGIFGEEYLQKNIKLLNKISAKQKEYFHPLTQNKKKLSDDIRSLKIDILINQLELTIKTKGLERKPNEIGKKIKEQTELYLKTQGWLKTIDALYKLKKDVSKSFNHFDWSLDFPDVLNPYLVSEEGGFDIVIGNPPYLKERENAHIFKIVNNSNFGRLWHQGKMDYWFYFLHKAIDITKTNGSIAFITSRYWLNSQGAKRLIERVSKVLSFVNVVDIGKLKVFDNVAGHHIIHIYNKGAKEHFNYRKLENNVNDIASKTSNSNVTLKNLQNSLVFKENNEIIFDDNILVFESSTQYLGDIYDVSQGVVEAPDKISSKQYNLNPTKEIYIGKGVFVLTEQELKSLMLSSKELTIIKPYLDPNDVSKYHISTSNQKYLIYSDKYNKSLINKDPSFRRLKNHLDSLKKYISSSNKPYGLHRPREQKYFEKPKIIFKNMFVKPEFAYDEEQFYFGFSFSSIIKKKSDNSLKYLLAILNSKFARNWFYTFGKNRGAGVDIGVEKLRTFPIPYTKKVNLFESFVDYIIFLRNQKLNEPNDLLIISYFEQILDGMIYELYFPELLKKNEREISKHLVELPRLNDTSNVNENLRVCRDLFYKIDNKNHPIRINLFYMSTLPEIKVIESQK